jgi:hypothetical protein
MADTDSDTENSDFESSLSSSVLYGAKQHLFRSPSRPRSSDRLYSTASSHRHVIPETEQSSLLNIRDGFRSYLATPLHEVPDPFESLVSPPRPLGILTRKISRVFQSKAYDYDSDKNALAAVGSGERVW